MLSKDFNLPKTMTGAGPEALREGLLAVCRKLRLAHGMVDRIMALTDGDGTAQECFYKILREEVDCRRINSIAGLISAARFPRICELSDFDPKDVTFQNDCTLEKLVSLAFVEEGKNVLMYGNSGTGKTMLSIIIGVLACRAGYPTRFYRTTALVNLLAELTEQKALGPFLEKFSKTRVIILDEFGYVPYNPVGIQQLYDCIADGYEKGNQVFILNTNSEFSEWVECLHSAKMTKAMVGRFVHKAEVLLFPGSDRRMLESNLLKMAGKGAKNES